MKWYAKLIIGLAILFLVGGIAFFGWTVRARQNLNEYRFQVEAMISATLVACGGEAVTDPSRSVVSEYEGRGYAVHPGNFKMLSFYLQENVSPAPFTGTSGTDPLRLTFCGESRILAERRDADRVLIQLETGDRTFRVQVRGGGLWEKLRKCCQEGTYQAENLSLDRNRMEGESP